MSIKAMISFFRDLSCPQYVIKAQTWEVLLLVKNHCSHLFQITLTDIVLHLTELKQLIRKESPCLKSEPEETGIYYDMRKVVCYIETKKGVKNVVNTLVITYAVLTKSYHKCPCKLTAL